MNPVITFHKFWAGGRPVLVLGALLLSVSSQACDAEEMIAQMRSACNDMVVGYQIAVGKPLATTAAIRHLAKARAHCQALEFDKAGLALALASRLGTVSQ